MNLHILKCIMCDKPVVIGANEKKEFYIACKPCDLLTPLTEVLHHAKELSVGNPIKDMPSTKHMFK